MSTPTREVGSVLAGRYRIDGFLKKGGMGSVYRATHLMLHRPCALKLIKPELVESADVVERFQREARNASQLEHPNIARIYDLGQADDGTLFIEMELVEGRSLRDLVSADGALDPARATRLARGIARALARAHARGIVHRDLKPQNVMVAIGDDGEEIPKLLDFGIAKSFESEEPALTQTGMVIGTPQYMSPEQAQGLPVDARADIYALGVILYEMLAGHVPFQDTSAAALLVKHLSAPPPPLALRRPGLPPGLVQIVERCLAKQPEARYSGADELVTLLAGPFDAPLSPPPPPDPITATVAATPPPAQTPPPRPTAAPPTPRRAPTAEAIAPVAPQRPPARGLSAAALVAILLLAGLVLAGIAFGAWMMLRGRGGEAGVAPADGALIASNPAGGQAEGDGTAAAPPPAVAVEPPGPDATSPAGPGADAATGAAGLPRAAAAPPATVPRRPAAAQAAPAPPVASEPPPRAAAAPPAIPKAPSVALDCRGVPDGRAAIQRALLDEFGRRGWAIRPERGEVQLDVEVEEVSVRQEQQFGRTVVLHTYSVAANAEAPRFDELVPMPPPESIAFDPAMGDKLNERSRVIASAIADRIAAYWSRKAP